MVIRRSNRSANTPASGPSTIGQQTDDQHAAKGVVLLPIAAGQSVATRSPQQPQPVAKPHSAVEYHSRRYGRNPSTLRMAAIDDVTDAQPGADAARDCATAGGLDREWPLRTA